MPAIPTTSVPPRELQLRGDRGYDLLQQSANDTTCRSGPCPRFPQRQYHPVNFNCVVIAGMTCSNKARTTPPVGAGHARDSHNVRTTP